MAKTIGHEHIWTFLTQAEQAQALAHAYLFVGPKHVGKRHVADQFARYLLCNAATGPSLFGGPAQARPCLTCDACKSLDNGVHQDFIVLAKDPEEQGISIEQTRTFLGRLTQSPALSKRKVAIVDEADLMTVGAANAFLKQLEEPTPTTTIILVSHDEQKLLATIVSRCQRIAFQPVLGTGKAQDIDEGLWKQSQGLPGLYIRYKASPSLAQQASDEEARLWNLIDMTPGQRLAFLDHLFQAKKKAHAVLKQEWDERLSAWQRSVRQAMLFQFTAQPPSFDAEPLRRIAWSAASYVRLYDQLGQVRRQLHRNVNIRAHIEKVFLDAD